MRRLYAGETLKYKQLTATERGKIEAYLSEGRSISWISRELSRSKSTIFDEIKRGKYNGKYKAHIEQNRAAKRRQCSHKYDKWKDYNLLIFIETRLKKTLVARDYFRVVEKRIRTNFFAYERLYADKKTSP